MGNDGDKKVRIIKQDDFSPLAKIIEIPIGAKAKFGIMIDRENAKARIHILEADLIIKYGFLKKNGGIKK